MALAAGTTAGESALREILGTIGDEQLGNLDTLLDTINEAMRTIATEDAVELPA